MPSSTNSANDREDPRDCNPMFKRLPAEVVARRSERGTGKKPQVQEKAPAATVELEQVLQKRPDGRAKWLAKALVQAADGRMDSQSLYSVVAHNRFIEDLTEKAGKRMYRALHANLHVFSSRQRKFLEKECALARKYAATAFQGIQKDGDEDEKQEQQASAVEDMMARCRAFVRERQSERGERQENGGDDEDQVEPEVAAPVPVPVPVPVAVAPVVTKGASRSRSASPKKEKVTKSNKKKAKESSGGRDSHSSERREKRKSRRSSGSSDHRSKKRRKDSDSDASDRKRKKKRH